MSQLTFAHPCSQTSPSALSLLAGAQSRRRALRTIEGPVRWSIDLQQRGHCSQIKKPLWAVVRRARLRWPLQVPQTDPSVQRAAKQTEVAADPMFDLNYHTAKAKVLLLDVLFLCFGGVGLEVIIHNEFCMSEETRERLSFLVWAQPAQSKWILKLP